MKRVMMDCCERNLKRPWLLLCLPILLAAAPRNARAADFCVAVNGGFGSGGTTFVGKGFIRPLRGTCKPWAGIVKTASTVVGTSTGAACMSDDGKLLTITLQTTDPEFFGNGTGVTDHVELCPLASTAGCPASSGQFDHGSFFSGPAAQVTCSTTATSIPSAHD
jgi:hypothetical protein